MSIRRLAAIAFVTVGMLVVGVAPAVGGPPANTRRIAAPLREFVLQHRQSQLRLSALATGSTGTAITHATQHASDPSTCLKQTYLDGRDGGMLDAWFYGLILDCTNHLFAGAVDTTVPITFFNFGGFIISVNRDNNASSGCHGDDVVIAAFPDPTYYDTVDLGAVETPTCNSNTWSGRGEPVDFAHPGSSSVGLAFPTSVIGTRSFSWHMELGDAADNIDLLPDAGEHAAALPNPPGAPRIGIASTANAAISVTFAAPLTNGGSGVVGYQTLCNSIDGGAVTAGSGTQSPIVSGRATIGKSYQCQARAQNAMGWGPWSTRSNVVVVRSAPDAPSIAAVEAGTLRATVNFSAPASDGGSPILSYRAECTADHTSWTSAVGWGSPIVVAGLAADVPYWCHVAATNAFGTGAASLDSAPTTPTSGPPDAPTNVHASSGDHSASVSWDPPIIDGGAAIDSYTVIAFPSGESVDTTSTSTEFVGLESGKSYRFFVTATSALGTSEPSTISNAVIPAGAATQSAIGFRSGPTVTVNGAYQIVTGDFNADTKQDVLWYAPGTAADTLWLATTDGHFATGPTVNVNGSYTPVVGDFNGDGADDIVWYGPGAAADAVWIADGNGRFHGGPALTVNGSYVPIVGDFNGDGFDDIFWYAPGAPSEALWSGSVNGLHATATFAVNGTYTPFVGDFNADGYSDIFWYAPGAGADGIWLSNGLGTFWSGPPVNVNGTYKPVVGDFNSDGLTDILWYAPGAGTDWLWPGKVGGGFAPGTMAPQVTGTYVPRPGDFDGDGRTDVLWYGPGSTPDALWIAR